MNSCFVFTEELLLCLEITDDLFRSAGHILSRKSRGSALFRSAPALVIFINKARLDVKDRMPFQTIAT